MVRKNKNIIGIDIGTAKVTVIAAEIDADCIAVTGVSTQPSYGVKKGAIINMESTIDSIKKAVEEVETMTGTAVRSAVVNISGSHIRGFSSNGVIPLSSREVKKADMFNALEAAKSFVIPMDREVVHILPQEFVVDDLDGIKDPLGMSGVRLESRAFIITAAVASVQNIIRCVNRSGLKVQDIILQQLASAESVLSEDEKELGCALIDIGGGTTDISIFSKGSPRYCSVLPIGGSHITSDIAIGLRTSLSEAEAIKKDFGNLCSDSGDAEHTIEVSGLGTKDTIHISKSMLNQIVAARTEETLDLILGEIESSGCLDLLAAGAVLTGGTALLRGLKERAEQILHIPVRVGTPCGINGINDIKNPLYATGVGLILFAARGYLNDFNTNGNKIHFRKFGQIMKHWFAEAF